MARVLAEERAAQLERVPLRGARDLVEEALGGEGGVRRADRAPPLHRHADLRRVQVDGEVRDRVGQGGCAFHRGGVDAVLHQHRFERGAGEDRLADDAVAPRDQPAARVEARFERVVVHGPVVARAHVVLAPPDQLHRGASVDRFCNRRRFQHEVGLRVGAPAEAAAGVQHVELHLLGLEPEELRHDRLVDGLELLAVPDLAACLFTIGVELHHAVHRLHAGVREVRELVGGLERPRRVLERALDVAVLARHGALGDGELLVLGHDFGRAQAKGARFVPLGAERVAALLRAPVVPGEHCDAVRRRRGERDDIDHALDGFCLGGVEALELRAEALGMQHHGGEHARQLHVLREHRAAVRLGARVGARRGLADVGELLRVLERNFGRHRLACGIGRKLAERQPAFLMLNHTFRNGDLRGRHAPFLRSRGDQHGARGGARLPQLLVGIGERGAAAGALRLAPEQVVVAARVGGRALDPDLRPVGVELLGDQRRQPGVGALPHLEVLHDHGDGVVGADPDKCVGRESILRLGKYFSRKGDSENEGTRRLEKIPAADVGDHASPLAARLMAARMRG